MIDRRGSHKSDEHGRCVAEGCYQRWPCDWAILCEELEETEARLNHILVTARAVVESSTAGGAFSETMGAALLALRAAVETTGREEE